MQLTVTEDAKHYVISFPYHPALVAEVKKLPERRFDAAHKVWTVPKSTARQLQEWVDRIQGVQIVMDDSIRAQMQEITTREKQSVEASRAASVARSIPVPEGLEYLPYQKAGIDYALARQNTLLADQMGLGKTIQAIGVWNADEAIKSVLVICPASLRLNWLREWTKWDVRQARVGIAGDVLPQSDVVIVNYDTLKRHCAAIHARSWDLLVCDEAHYMKSNKALRTLYVLGGRRRSKEDRGGWEVFKPIAARRKLLLTGTPIVNRPAEAWTLIHALAPDVFSNWSKFAWRYCAASAGKYGMDFGGASNLEELQDRLRATIMVRRLKEDVLTELPAKRRQIIEFDADIPEVSDEQAAYQVCQEQLEALKLAVELAKGGNDEEYAAAAGGLQQGAMAAFAELSRLRHATALAKVPYVVEHLKDAIESGKVVCFAHHKDVIAALLKQFPGVSVSVTGDTPMQARQDAVDRFQNDPQCTLFVGNLKAAGVGFTLTAASHVIFAELDWVPGNLTQAEDRCHRIGQLESVLVQHLVLQGSLDATMAKRVVAKQKVIDAALDIQDEMNSQPILPMMSVELPATENTTRKQIVEEAALLQPQQIEAIHQGLGMLAAMCDGAASLDGHGFNKLDTNIGKSLAACRSLTPKQAALGKRLVTKYRRQLPESLIKSICE